MFSKPDLYFLKKKRGTPWWLYHKWYRKFWLIYPKYAEHGTNEPSSAIRKQFIRDLYFVIENEINRLFPEKSLIINKEELWKMMSEE